MLAIFFNTKGNSRSGWNIKFVNGWKNVITECSKPNSLPPTKKIKASDEDRIFDHGSL